jgi:transcription elongation factor SPT6
MFETPQFLHILAAEAEHLVTVSIFLPPDAEATFEGRLIDAFSSDSFSDTVKAWNEERALVIRETLDSHLIPLGVKWVREWLREEVENLLAMRCVEFLRDVRQFYFFL